MIFKIRLLGKNVCTLLFLLILFCMPDLLWSEPLSQSTRFPLMLMVLTPEPQSPVIPQDRISYSLTTDYSTVFMDKYRDHWTALVDMEMAVVTPEVTLRLGERFTLSASLPLVRMADGFADGFLEDYHDFGHFQDYGRSFRPHNEFAYAVTKDGLPWFEAEKNGVHLADSRVLLKYLWTATPDWALSALYTLKLPTGNEVKGYGSGHADHGFFLLSRFTAGKMIYYLNPGLILPHDPETLGADVEFHTMACLFAGGEYLVGGRLSLNTQFNIFESPLKDTDIPHLDDACIELAMGLSFKASPGIIWDLSFTEDISGPSSDFTLRTSIRTGF